MCPLAASDNDVGTLEVTEKCDDGCWDEYIHAHPSASGYHQIAWRRILEDSFGHRTIYLTVEDQLGEVRGVLPLVCMSSRLFGCFLISLPFFNYGGVLADDHRVQNLLLEAAVRVAKDLKAEHIELRQTELLDLGWSQKQHKVSMRLELPSDFDTLWKCFPSKLRSQVRRAQKAGMTVYVAGEELLDDFYQVFSRNMRDLGTPVYGKEFFKSILHTFPKEAKICTVSLEGKPLAVGFLYGFREMLEIPWASSDRRFAGLAPNMLLYSSVLEYACRSGFRMFDFGRSTVASGTYRFKEQWGARPLPLFWYYWLDHSGPLPELNPQNPKYSLAISLWRRLPIPLTRIIGPHIARHLP